MTKYGYCRVSTVDQMTKSSLDSQKQQLIKEGISPENIYCDVMTGQTLEKTNLDHLVNLLQKGDELYIVRLDRLGKRAWELLDFISLLKKRGVEVIPLDLPLLKENQEFTLVFSTICASLTETEYLIRAERQRAGIQKAKELGVYKGRKPVIDENLKEKIRRFLQEGHKKTEIAEILKISRSTVYNAIKASDLEKAQEV